MAQQEQTEFISDLVSALTVTTLGGRSSTLGMFLAKLGGGQEGVIAQDAS